MVGIVIKKFKASTSNSPQQAERRRLFHDLRYLSFDRTTYIAFLNCKQISKVLYKSTLYSIVDNCWNFGGGYYLYQRDNGLIHTSQLTKKWFSNTNVYIMLWSTRSLDLNLGETLWRTHAYIVTWKKWWCWKKIKYKSDQRWVFLCLLRKKVFLWIDIFSHFKGCENTKFQVKSPNSPKLSQAMKK